MRQLVRFVRRDDRGAPTDASRVVRKKCRVPRVQNSGVVSRLNMILGVLETL